MSRGNLAWLLGITITTILGLSIAFSAPPRGGNLRSQQELVNLMIDVLFEVKHKYVKELDEKQMRNFVENMVDGGLQSLDPHSNFINADDLKSFNQRTKGEFSGVGIKITLNRKRHPFIEVESPMVGTPAHRAGVLPEDIIIKVDGKSTENMKLSEVAKLIQGKRGEEVTLTVVRRGVPEPLNIDIVRDTIAIDSVIGFEPLTDADKKWEYIVDKENKVAYIRIEGFTESTVDELAHVIQDLQDQGMKGLILDLRNNPGGLLRSAVEVSSMFLPENKKVVSIKGRGKKKHTEYSSAPRYGKENKVFEPITDVPIAIILNPGSASASEIVAAALKDHLRAIIVGERSYGKGSVQNVIFLENGNTAMKLTTASYWRPNDKNIHRFPDSKEEDDWGVKPSKGYKVKLSDEERIAYYKYRREKDILGKPGGGEPKKKDENKEEPFVDRQLEKALEYIRGEIKGNNNAAAPQPVRPSAQAQNALPVLPQGVGPMNLSQAWVINDNPRKLGGLFRADVVYC